MAADLEDRLDDIFHALANRTRRALLRDLASGPARVTELAEPYGMSVNDISKHLFVLERAGLIRRTKAGHVQSCMLHASRWRRPKSGWLTTATSGTASSTGWRILSRSIRTRHEADRTEDQPHHPRPP
jgi:DNA-binding transcriptional ArsR family regulator